MANSVALLEKETTKEKFINIYQAVHSVSKDDAANFLEVELFNFKSILRDKPKLKECNELSVAGVFLEVISNGLSFDSGSRHVYLIPRGRKLTYQYTAEALIFLTVSAGSIKDCSVPTIVYEGDEISVSTVNNMKVINHTPKIPRQSEKIIGGFCIKTLADGSKDAFWMDVSSIERLKKYSAKSGGVNALYSSGSDGQIDEGFFKTKIVKAALKNVRRKKTLTDNEYDDTYEESPSMLLSVAESYTEDQDIPAESIPSSF